MKTERESGRMGERESRRMGVENRAMFTTRYLFSPALPLSRSPILPLSRSPTPHSE